MKQYLDASLPMEIVEAARIDGAGEFYTFNHIVLPIMKPALAVLAIAKGWQAMVVPALLVGTLGYVIGNYYGIFIGTFLGR